MILEFSDWLVFTDLESTREYYTEEVANHCTCAYCRNFYSVVDRTYPDLRYFLSRFGINIEAPESLMPMNPSLYQASYAVQGKILRAGTEPIWINSLAITLESDAEPDWFFVHLGLMELPWSLPQHQCTVPKPYGLSDMLDDLKSNIKMPPQK